VRQALWNLEKKRTLKNVGGGEKEGKRGGRAE